MSFDRRRLTLTRYLPLTLLLALAGGWSLMTGALARPGATAEEAAVVAGGPHGPGKDGATGGGARPMPVTAVPLEDSLYLGAPLVIENATVWPVYSSSAVASSDAFISLAKAQEEGLARVLETGAVGRQEAAPAPDAAPDAGPAQEAAPAQNAPTPEAYGVSARNVEPAPIQQRRTVSARGAARSMPEQRLLEPYASGDSIDGNVNELVIENKGSRPILVLAGTLVKGGKQDRQIAQDFIVPPGKQVPVDAFCVEQGRWTAQREGQSTGGVFQAQKVLASKKVRGRAQFQKNQSAVWAGVAEENAKAGKAPGTGTYLATVEETDAQAVERRKRVQESLEKGFADRAKEPVAPVGVAYAIEGKVQAVRVFSSPDLFGQYTETLFSTVAIEADLAHREKQSAQAARAAGAGRPNAAQSAPADVAVDAGKVLEMVNDAAAAKEELEATRAGNVNGVRKGSRVWSAACYYPEPGRAPVTKNWQEVE